MAGVYVFVVGALRLGMTASICEQCMVFGNRKASHGRYSEKSKVLQNILFRMLS